MKTFIEWQKSLELTDEMKALFDKRTNHHIDLVKKYADKIEKHDPKRFEGLVKQTENHDASKLESPEYEPYVLITWQYHCKDKGIEFKPDEKFKEMMTAATIHHITHNQHHPDFFAPDKSNLINKENRDKPPEKLIDATKMDDLSLAEMCADWLGMAEEKGTNAKDWAKKNINVRWKFTPEQEKLIYDIIGAALLPAVKP